MALGRPLLALDLPGHGHSDGPGRGGHGLPDHARRNAEDVSRAMRPSPRRPRLWSACRPGVLTTIALTDVAPDLVRKVVLVDVTPGLTPAQTKQISDFVGGPPTFANFDELLERTIRYNPTRSVSSLRHGILHNAVQRDDGTWIWRWASWREGLEGGQPGQGERPVAAERSAPTPPRNVDLWDVVGRIRVPVMLRRGMLPIGAANNTGRS